MTQFTVEISAVGHKEEVISAENGQDAYDEVKRQLDEELPEWLDITVHDVNSEGTGPQSSADD